MTDIQSDHVVHIDNIRKSFGTTVAIDHLDMKIRKGEFVTFLGPSGCGKSTTLRILGGFEMPDRGRILLNGEDVTTLPPNRRNVNMVFQDYALFPHMTVRKNIAFGLELKRMSGDKIATRTQELTAFLELQSYIDRYPDQLSGGQRQRVALSRALAPDPAMLLLDEPLAALDAKLRAQVQLELKSIQRRTGKTFFFVTHDQDEAMTMSDRIVVMNEGRVEQDGTPQELYHHPANRFVANFIGDTNLIEGKVIERQGGELLLDWQGVLLRGAAQKGTPGPGERANASLRPENIRIAGEPGSGVNVFEARLRNPVFKGSRSTIEVHLPGIDDIFLMAYIDSQSQLSLTDDKAWISFGADKLTILRG